MLYIWFISFNLLKEPHKFLFLSFYRLKNWGLKTLNKFHKFTQLENDGDRTGIMIQLQKLPKYLFSSRINISNSNSWGAG